MEALVQKQAAKKAIAARMYYEMCERHGDLNWNEQSKSVIDEYLSAAENILNDRDLVYTALGEKRSRGLLQRLMLMTKKLNR